ATPSRVFAAFASAEARKIWGVMPEFEEAEPTDKYELDFRVGGRERFGFKHRGVNIRYDAQYYDIIPDQRIIYSYEMYMDDLRISVAVATIEFAENGDGTALTWTEQGAYLDGIEGPMAGQQRRQGTREMVDELADHLDRLVSR